MKVLLSWLNEMAPFGDDVDALADAMNILGMEVNTVERVGQPVPGVVVARVLETRRHPEAERVQQVLVDAGGGDALHVWCGAFNMRPGDLVPLATIGTVMPDGRQIGKRKILGEVSEGMLCSAVELGLGDDAAGILVLPSDLELGADVMGALGITEDAVFDLELTRNRPDAYGHLGVARDLGAHLGLALTAPGAPVVADGPERRAPVEIVDPDRCGRFVSVVLSGVKVTESPSWMAERLRLVGMRPISNVVDVSNYVMLELNEPNHAYDLERLGGGGFRIRRARVGETMITLDGVERVFTPDDLLICDAHDEPVGLAGIMGGRDTEIDESTTVVALEMAWFEPVGIAQSVGRLGLRSEASVRFERGRDPYGIDRAIGRFVELLRLTCPDLVVHVGLDDARGDLPDPHRRTPVRVSEVNRILGSQLTATDIRGLLDPVGYTVEGESDGVLTVVLPSWRLDSVAEIDVIEEVARHYGYEKLGKTVPKSIVHGRLSAVQERRRVAHDVLLGLGLTEVMPNPFLSPDDQARAGITGPAISIANPLVAEESVLRTSLRPGLLKAVAYNESHRRPGVAVYELGHVYPPGDEDLPDEYEALGVVLAGRDAPAAVDVLNELRWALGVEDRVRLEQQADLDGLHPARGAVVTGPAGRPLGIVGEIHPDVAEAFGVGERLAYLELDLGAVLAMEPAVHQARPVSRFPSSDIDLAFAVADDIPAAAVVDALRAGTGELLVDLTLFDVYRGPGLAEGDRSVAFRLRLQAPDRTLTDAEVGAARQRAIDAAAAAGARLRG